MLTTPGDELSATLPYARADTLYMPRRLSLRANFSWTAAAALLYSLIQSVMLLILVKLTDPGAVGIYTLGVAITTPVIMLTSLGLTEALVTDLSEPCAYGRYITLRLLLSLLSVLIVVGVVMVRGLDPDTALSRDAAMTIIVIGLGTAVYAVRDIFIAIMRHNECMNLAAISQAMIGLAGLAMFGTILWLTRSLFWAVMGVAAERTMVLVFHDIGKARQFERVSGQFRLTVHVMPLLKLGLTTLPLGLSATLAAVIMNMPRYLLEMYHGEEQLGYYGAIAFPLIAAQVLMNTLIIAATPRLARLYVENRRGFVVLLGKLLAIATGSGILCLVGAAVVGKPALRILFKPEYALYHREFVVLMLALTLLFLVSFINQSIVASRGFRHVLVANVIVLGLSFLINRAFISTGGVMGACWGLTASYGAWLSMMAVLLLLRIRAGRKGPASGRDAGYAGTAGEARSADPPAPG